MSIVVQMHIPGVTKEQYDLVRREVNWEQDVPRGAKFHVVWFAEDGGHVLDLWDSADDFYGFVADRLSPSLQRIGIVAEPRIQITKAHAIFAPNV
jgi:hypothetical protein